MSSGLKRAAVAALLLGGACSSSSKDGEPERRQQRDKDSDQHALAKLGSARRPTLRALALPWHSIAARLGPHRVGARSKLVARAPGRQRRVVEQQLELRVDAKGQFVASKQTHPQYGFDVVWTGGWLYPRVRYSDYTRRRPDTPREPQQIADRLYGMLPGYVALLAPHLRIVGHESARVRGRDAVVVKLGRAQKPSADKGAGRGPAGSWRSTIEVEKLTGRAALDRRTGAPLEVELKARWSFVPPADTDHRSGIPRRFAKGKRGTMRLVFSQKLTKLGQINAIEPPPDEQIRQRVSRRRLEIERQMITGERKMLHGFHPPD